MNLYTCTILINTTVSLYSTCIIGYCLNNWEYYLQSRVIANCYIFFVSVNFSLQIFAI